MRGSRIHKTAHTAPSTAVHAAEVKSSPAPAADQIEPTRASEKAKRRIPWRPILLAPVTLAARACGVAALGIGVSFLSVMMAPERPGAPLPAIWSPPSAEKDEEEGVRPPLVIRPGDQKRTEGAAIAVRFPKSAREREAFSAQLRRLHLEAAVEDGVLTLEEATRAGVDFETLRRNATTLDQLTSEPPAIDEYFETLGANPKNERIRAPSAIDLLDPKNSGDYVVITAPAYERQLEPLLEHRALGGHHVVMVTPKTIEDGMGIKGPPAIRAYLAKAAELWKDHPPHFVLLVGDTRGYADGVVPSFELSRDQFGNSAMLGKTFVSDHPYADIVGDARPELAVGRISPGGEQHLPWIERSIIGYEIGEPSGDWQARVQLIDGDPHVSEVIDRVCDAFVSRRLESKTERRHEVLRHSFNPTNSDRVVLDPGGGVDKGLGYVSSEELRGALARGSFLNVYTGHGDVHGVDGLVAWRADRMRPDEGKPIALITSCLAGAFDADSPDCLTEALVSQGAAVAAIGAAEVTLPEENLVWTEAAASELLDGEAPTLGDAIVRAKHRLATNAVDGETRFAHDVGKAFTQFVVADQPDSHLYLYNLIGDPATVLRRPERIRSLQLGEAHSGSALTIRGSISKTVGPGQATLTLERIDRARVLATRSVSLEAPSFTTELPIPASVPAGRYHLRITIAGEKEVAAEGRTIEVK